MWCNIISLTDLEKKNVQTFLVIIGHICSKNTSEIITWHFCNHSTQQMIDMLLLACINSISELWITSTILNNVNISQRFQTGFLFSIYPTKLQSRCGLFTVFFCLRRSQKSAMYCSKFFDVNFLQRRK